MHSRNNTLRIEPVSSRRELKQFINLTRSLYESDPNWVPPLQFELEQRLSTKKNPFFEHAHWQAWTAKRGERLVGRISAQIDRLLPQQNGSAIGYFGMLEAENDQELFLHLLQTAEVWLRDQNIKQVRGPFNLSINEECGLLIEGFNTPPCIMMGHALPYYGQQVEAAGYQKAQDLLAYTISSNFTIPRVMKKLIDYARTKATLRHLRRKQLKQELEILRGIFNNAWERNWGFVPFTQAEFREIGQMLIMLVKDEDIQIAEINKRPVGMVVILPNINEAIRDLNGSLFPIGWLKLLWRLKVKYPSSARIALMGVLQEYQQTRLGPALAFLLVNALKQPMIRRGVRDVELSWILESNRVMRNINETVGGKLYKRYRIYEKHL